MLKFKSNNATEIYKNFLKNQLVETYLKLDLLMNRIEWADADGINTGIGKSSANENIARESAKRDMERFFRRSIQWRKTTTRS